MNKQELDGLIANNSVRMTNRQWLESLSDEEFERKIHWLCVEASFCDEWGKCYEYRGSCSRCRLAWLRAEHKE